MKQKYIQDIWLKSKSVIEEWESIKLTNSDQREHCLLVAEGQFIFIHLFYKCLWGVSWVSGIV